MFRHNRIVVGVMVTIIVSMVLIAWAGEKKKEEIIRPAVERLVSDEWSEIAKARDELIASRKKLIGDLIGIIGTKENITNRQKQNNIRAVMDVLGEMRAVEAIDVLVEYISFPKYTDSNGIFVESWRMPGSIFEDMGRTYPAAGALVKIGEPCLEAVQEKLCHFVGIHDLKSCLTVLVHLQEVEAVNKYLKERLEKETDAEVKRRLENAIRYLADEKAYDVLILIDRGDSNDKEPDRK